MEVGEKGKIKEYLILLTQRGLGIYGYDKMASICRDAGLILLEDDTLQFISDDYDQVFQKFLVNYAKFNLIAKMTVMAFAKQYGVKVPYEIKNLQKKKSKFRKTDKNDEA